MLFVFCLITVISGILVHEIFRRYPLSSLVLFLAAPLILTPFWGLSEESFDWFFWIKIYFIIFGACFLLFLRTREIKRKKWPYYFIYFVLVVNILVAVTRMFLFGTWPTSFLGIAGLLLIATLPSIKSLSVDPAGYQDLLWDIPYGWIMGYNIWDWVFVYLIFPYHDAIQFSFLLSPTLICLFNRKLWLQARACTLSFYLIVMFSVPYFEKISRNSGLKVEYSNIILGSFGLLWLVGYSIFHFVKLKR